MAPNFGLANPASVDLTNMTEDKMRAITCYMYNGSNDYDGQLGEFSVVHNIAMPTDLDMQALGSRRSS